MSSTSTQPVAVSSAPLERHYSAKEIAELWHLNVDTVRKLFAGEDGVIRLGGPETRYKRGYSILRVPESVMLRVHKQLQNPLR